MQITIEPVKITELHQLAEISRTTFYDTFHQQNTKEDMYTFLNTSLNISTLQNELSDPKNYFFFARANNALLGYLKLTDGDRPAELKGTESIEIARLYSVKDKIGTGIGKALMEFAIAFGKQQNKQVIWLGVWELNQRAIAFYEKFGFEKFGEHKFVLGNDLQNDWLMKKTL